MKPSQGLCRRRLRAGRNILERSLRKKLKTALTSVATRPRMCGVTIAVCKEVPGGSIKPDFALGI
jgi:hypothetical protein